MKPTPAKQTPECECVGLGKEGHRNGCVGAGSEEAPQTEQRRGLGRGEWGLLPIHAQSKALLRRLLENMPEQKSVAFALKGASRGVSQAHSIWDLGGWEGLPCVLPLLLSFGGGGGGGPPYLGAFFNPRLQQEEEEAISTDSLWSCA